MNSGLDGYCTAGADSCLSMAAYNDVGMIRQIFTIGHSNHPLERVAALLQQHQIAILADIRRFPSSKKFPHFNRESFAHAMSAVGIDYHWLEALGRRRPAKDGHTSSPNAGLENASFRHYADCMLTDDFRQGAVGLLEIAGEKRTALMCAEAVFGAVIGGW